MLFLKLFAIIFINFISFCSVNSDLNNCGKSLVGKGNIIGGSQVPRGVFPWSTALVKSDGQFFCGGTLISKTKIITAAHCIHEKHSTRQTTAHEIRVLLGVYDLNDQYEVGRFTAAVKSIEIHPDWNPNIVSFDADIAIITLEEPVQFTKYIQPICLNSPVSSKGFVVGYGKSEDLLKNHENIPKIIETPIHENANCFLKNQQLVSISSSRTFCGGSGDGQGVCTGDSGSGLFVIYQQTFYLRGIVSSSLFKFGQSCDVDSYSVFTDISHFNGWILDNLGNLTNSNSVSINEYERKFKEIQQSLENQKPIRTTGVWVQWSKFKEGVPENAVRSNYDDNDKYYVHRAYHEGDLIPGKFAILERKSYISYDGKEYIKDNSELLTHTNYVWSDNRNDGLQLIDGGEDKYGTKLYICRVAHKETWVGGKLLNNFCYFPWGGEELNSSLYQALKRKS
ncbi:unnamed protein product [Chironomus riparius]|uniref:Peptidase S1 domain-containing protein n=1 Tax=Chironomus riparius TaxID=315576 RepID=A0A9N9SAW2_9DIPT|nr:unnamed protein product [Chironomus riparius]